MSKLANPTDAAVAQHIGELELTRIRMAWMLEQQSQQIKLMGLALNERDAMLAAKDAEIVRLRQEANEPSLPLHANGKHVELKH